MPETITSPQNPKIKDLLVLETQSRERKARGLFVVEGRREFERACAAGFEPVTVFVREGDTDRSVFAVLAAYFPDTENISNIH